MATRLHMRRTAARRRSQVSTPFILLPLSLRSFPFTSCTTYRYLTLPPVPARGLYSRSSGLPVLHGVISESEHAMSREHHTPRDIHQLR
jgi:hypothetical protein